MNIRDKATQRKLNSMTKYPSIETYHKLGDRGCLTQTRNVNFDGDKVVGTEKVDGSNARIVLLPSRHGYLIGSREDFLYHEGDVIWNDNLGIVEHLQPVANVASRSIDADVFNPYRIQIAPTFLDELRHGIIVLYLEVYGASIKNRAVREYTSTGVTGHRLFDVACIQNHEDIDLLGIEDIALWRQNGGQQFLAEEELQAISEYMEIPLTPRIEVESPPTSVEDAFEYLQNSIAKSQVTLDENAKGTPEGLVIRTADRSKIAKMRFREYARTAVIKRVDEKKSHSGG